MSKMLLLAGLLALAACPHNPDYGGGMCDPDDVACADYYYGSYELPTPETTPFMQGLERIVTERVTGFASFRSGEGVRIADGIQNWPQSTAVLPPFRATSCTVTRYDAPETRTSDYVFLCGATDKPATLADAESLMTDQIGRVVTSWRPDHSQDGTIKTWQWGPPGQEPVIYLRAEAVGDDQERLVLFVWSRKHPFPSTLVGKS